VSWGYFFLFDTNLISLYHKGGVGGKCEPLRFGMTRIWWVNNVCDCALHASRIDDVIRGPGEGTQPTDGGGGGY